ncbi:MAG TPA: TOMM precursor leader peptide-binding protein, partial [Kofleriaceae bacterium]
MPSIPGPRRPDTQRILRFRSDLRSVADGDDRVFLIGDDERILIVGRAHARVAALIDGRRSVARVLAELAGELHPAVAHDALAALEARGYLIAAEPLAPVRAAVRALADGDGADLLRDALGAAGVALDDGAPVQIVVVDDYLAPALDAVGREALASGAAWWLVKLAGAQPWIGPAFRPGGPCWACLAHRLRDNRPVERYLARRGQRIDPPRGGDPAVRRAAASWAALAIRNAISEQRQVPGGSSSRGLRAPGARAAPANRLSVFDPRGPLIVEHTVLRRPQCAVCGDPALFTRRASAPILLAERLVDRPTDRPIERFVEHPVVRPIDRPIERFVEHPVEPLAEGPANGGGRMRSAAETFERHAHLVDALTGAISSLGPVAGTGDLVWAASVFTHPPSDASSAAASFDDFHATSMGKGETSEQARAAALGEAIERLSAAYQGDEPVRIASLRELEASGESAIHPDALQLFSPAQLAGRDAWNRVHDDARRHVPLPFDRDARVAWTPAWSLSH